VGVLTVQIVLTCLPVTIFADGWAFLRHVEEDVRRSSEILLAMSIVAFAPFMFLIN
jgi:hypothetical protein